jgi:hypothetical protein
MSARLSGMCFTKIKAQPQRKENENALVFSDSLHGAIVTSSSYKVQTYVNDA